MTLSSKTKKKKPAHPSVATNVLFPVVAIGASAGGLDAITRLLQNLSPDTGMAFVYVQHLSPDHKSILTSLLAKSTLMKVQEVKNKMLIQPNNLYVIPPGKEMFVMDGHIKLIARARNKGLTLPIDTFFNSLAEKRKEFAIGVILSGTGIDGTLGLAAIKQAGGVTFSQDSSAKFSSMPKSAIAAGAVDFILSPKEIGRELNRLSKHDYAKRLVLKTAKEIENDNPDLRSILRLLYKETGVDFSQYKLTTIKRRIQRRVLLNKVKSLAEYAKQLAGKNDEITILYQDLLINVTAFFRDTDAHRYLKTVLFPKILSHKTIGEPLRIWVPACSTGEEVYSIAMTLLEVKSTKTADIPIQIFATDLSQKAISKARLGEYSKQDLKSISPKRLQRFYTLSGGNYRIAKVVRDMCVFAPHNILSDPPFSRVDFISCCNLLIYLDADAQKKVISTFNYALKAGGYLMLGKSETIGSSGQSFTRVNLKYKIYAKKEKPGKRLLPGVNGRILPRHSVNKSIDTQILRVKRLNNHSFNSIVDGILLGQYVPASVVVNHAMEILGFRGATDPYLRHTAGKASLNILKMVPPEIAFELRQATAKVIKTNEAFRKSGIEMKSNDLVRIISIEIVPIKAENEEPLLLIIFAELKQVNTFLYDGKGNNGSSTNGSKVVSKLRKELLAARAEMQSFAQEQEAFHEELQNANEEVVSSNEELQSVNEELETSKEEIESTNEELITTNQELQTRNELLNESYDYSEAIIGTIHEPMLILDKELRVKSANKSFYTIFRLTEENTVHHRLYELGNRQWDIPRLRELLEDIIPKNTRFHDFEVKQNFSRIGQKTLLLNASRIIQKSHGEQLILLAINDITEHTLMQQKEKELLKKHISDGKSHSMKLERAVEQRTQELGIANKTLEEKNYELEKMNKELEAFAYVSSHDLQEPLRKIQTFSSRILETENSNLTDKGKDYFIRMQSAAGRMQRLIEDLLAFSRLSVTERRFENIDLTKIIDEVKVDLKDTIEEKRAIVKTSALCKVRVIPFQFRQLMYNLLSNALKFSNPELPPRITITSRFIKGGELKERKLLQEKKYCHISVTDNGIGFDPQYKDRIFEVFQRLHGRQEYSGTGIGLAIVKKVVDNHNGFITVSSKLGKGAVFNIYIPVQ